MSSPHVPDADASVLTAADDAAPVAADINSQQWAAVPAEHLNRAAAVSSQDANRAVAQSGGEPGAVTAERNALHSGPGHPKHFFRSPE